MKPVKKDPPRKPIYVRDPKDKRLLAYNDSLNTYELNKEFRKEIYSKLNSAKTKEEYDKINNAVVKKFVNRGMNPGLFVVDKNEKVFIKRDFGNGAIRIDTEASPKKPVQPVFLEEKTEKVNIAPKELNMPTSSIKVNRAVNFPKTVTGVKYDTQKGDVIVGISGKEVTMPRKEFDSWVNKPENRKMFDDYRKRKAKK